MLTPDLSATSQPWYNPGYLSRQGFLDRLKKHDFFTDLYGVESYAPTLMVQGAVNGASFGLCLNLPVNPLADHKSLLLEIYDNFQQHLFIRMPEMVGHA